MATFLAHSITGTKLHCLVIDLYVCVWDRLWNDQNGSKHTI